MDIDSASSLTPVAPHEALSLQHVGLGVLESSLREGNLYAETLEKDRFFTKDQMVGVLAAIEGRSLRPDRAQFWRERAVELWEGSEVAFVEGTFYAATVPAPTGIVCVDLLANSWALRAANAMVDAGIAANPDPSDRATELRELLGAFLTAPTSKGKPFCPQESTTVPVHQRPLLYLALLESRDSGEPNIDSALLTSIKSTITSSFDVAFRLPDGLYLALLNAQMLAVLTDAELVFDDEQIAKARDGVAGWLQNESIEPVEGGQEVRTLIREGSTFVVQPGGSPDANIWSAYALANLARHRPDLVRAGVVEGLLESYLDLFWDSTTGGFAAEGGVVYADYNLLPAILSRALPLSVSAIDPSTLAFVVPARSDFVFPPPNQQEAENLYILNQWTARFNVPFEPAGPSPFLISARALAPFNLSGPRSDFFPAPRLVRAGTAGATDVRLEAVANDPNLLRFTPQLSSGQNAFRFDAYVPARPVFSHFGSTISILLESHAREAVTVGTLQVELDATEIRIRTATLDNALLTSLEVIDPVITEQLPAPHMRLLLSDVVLPPGRSELLIGYTDIIRPEVGVPSLTRDLEGRDVVTADGDEPIQVLQGESMFVRATVRDNGALRSVQLRYRTVDESLDVRMEPVPGQADVYAVQLPTGGQTGQAVIQVVAIDAAGTGNLNESGEVEIDLRDPLFAGSIVLFVFSGTLFVASLIIWVKVRRKALR